MKEMLGTHNEWGVVTENDDNALYESIKTFVSDRRMIFDYSNKAKKRREVFMSYNTVSEIEHLL